MHAHWGGENSRGSEHTVDGKVTIVTIILIIVSTTIIIVIIVIIFPTAILIIIVIIITIVIISPTAILIIILIIIIIIIVVIILIMFLLALSKVSRLASLSKWKISNFEQEQLFSATFYTPHTLNIYSIGIDVITN